MGSTAEQDLHAGSKPSSKYPAEHTQAFPESYLLRPVSHCEQEVWLLARVQL